MNCQKLSRLREHASDEHASCGICWRNCVLIDWVDGWMDGWIVDSRLPDADAAAAAAEIRGTQADWVPDNLKSFRHRQSRFVCVCIVSRGSLGAATHARGLHAPLGNSVLESSAGRDRRAALMAGRRRAGRTRRRPRVSFRHYEGHCSGSRHFFFFWAIPCLFY